MKIPTQLTIERSTLLSGAFGSRMRRGCGCVVGQLMGAMGWAIGDDFMPYRFHLGEGLSAIYAKNDALVETHSPDLEAEIIDLVGKLGCELRFVGEWAT